MGASYSSGGSSSGTGPSDILKAYTKFLPKILQAGGEANLANIQGIGGETARAAADLTRQTSPEYYEALKRAGGATDSAIANAASNVANANKLVSNINLTGLSPGEYNAIERSTNQSNTATGNLGLANPTNVVANAMNFGGAFNNKLGLFQNAVNTQTAAAGNSNAAANSATGLAGIASPAASGVNASNLAMGGGDTFANNFLNVLSKRGSSSQSGMSGQCCFIFMEAYYGDMPVEVRKFRDKYYRLKPSIAVGYKKMAKWLVPLMQKSSLIRQLVWNVMIKPATEHCKHSSCNINKTISHFWLKLWSIYGKI